MIYRAIGLMSGSSLDGLDIVFVEFDESGGKWNYEIKQAACIPYDAQWQERLRNAVELPAYDYLLLHSLYGKFVGQLVNDFIAAHGLDHQVQLIASHGHTVFHAQAKGMTAQLGDGASIAATTGINVVSDLRAVDVAFGGQGAPIVPIGEKLLLKEYDLFLNIGGIANISAAGDNGYVAYDICSANRVLDMLARQVGSAYDAGGAIAASGNVHTGLLTRLNALEYYKLSFPKSLDNSFATQVVYPAIIEIGLSVPDAMRTYVEHIAMQVGYNCQQWAGSESRKMLVTGGGAHNSFLIQRIAYHLQALQIEVVVPTEELINYKEALIMALIGILRWREEYNVLSSVTGAARNSINGAVWMGQEA